MNDNNYDPQINQNNPNIINNTENLQQPIIGGNMSQNNGLETPKSKKTLLIIVIITIVLVIFGVVGFFIINNLNKPKVNSKLSKSNSVSTSNVSNVPFVSEGGKKYIDESNKQYGVRFDNQVILTARVPIDSASTNPKAYDGVAAVAIDVSECNHISITSVSMLTCFLDKAGKNYYNVVASSNNLGAFDNIRDIANSYEKQTYSLTSKGIAYDDVNVYTEWYKTGILHIYFGHLGVSGQYSPYFYITFNKASTEKDSSYNSEANADMYYKKMSIINVPRPVSN